MQDRRYVAWPAAQIDHIGWRAQRHLRQQIQRRPQPFIATNSSGSSTCSVRSENTPPFGKASREFTAKLSRMCSIMPGSARMGGNPGVSRVVSVKLGNEHQQRATA